MTPEAFADALRTLGLDKSQAAAARALGCTPRAVRHWLRGGRRVRGPVVVLVQVLLSMA